VKRAELEKLKGKKIAGAGGSGGRSAAGSASDRRDQALARKRELLEARRKPKA